MSIGCICYIIMPLNLLTAMKCHCVFYPSEVFAAAFFWLRMENAGPIKNGGWVDKKSEFEAT